MTELVICEEYVRFVEESLLQNSVSVANQGLKIISAEDASDLCARIASDPNLKALQLEGNSLGVEGAESIAQVLKHKKEFKYAYWRDMLTGRMRSETPLILKSMTTALMSSACKLHTLDISDNAFGPLGPQGIAAFLRSPSAFTLEVLKINNGGIGIQGSQLLAESLEECHKLSVEAGNPLKLRVFVAGRNRLENKGCTAIAEAIKRIGTLEEIQIPQNGIYYQGISALLDACKYNPRLRILNTQDNTYNAVGAKKLVQVLPFLKHLEVLKIDDCLVRSQGAVLIANAIKQHNNQKLKKLWLSGNAVNSIAMEKSLEILKECKLEIMHIGDNNYGSKWSRVNQIAHKMPFDVQIGEEDDDGGTESEEEDEENEVVSGEGYESEEEGVKQDNVCEEFRQFPSEPLLSDIMQSGGPKFLMEQLHFDTQDVNLLANIIVNLASLVIPTNPNNIQARVFAFVDGLMEEVVRNNLNQSNFANVLSLKMGFIKAEDDKGRLKAAEVNSFGCKTVAMHILQQSYLNKATKDIISFVVSRNKTG